MGKLFVALCEIAAVGFILWGLACIKAGDRRPEILALYTKIRRCPAAIVSGYKWQVDWYCK